MTLTVQIIGPDNTVVRRSKNLRGIFEHSRLHGKPHVRVTQTSFGAAVYCRWSSTGDTCNLEFASFEVACQCFSRRSANLETLLEEPCL